MLKTLSEKWNNLRIITEFTSIQKKRLARLQLLYCQKVKQANAVEETLANTFLETNEDGIPTHCINVESMNRFERYTDSGPLVSYANMIQTKIINYLLERQQSTATYSNDANSLFCLQMLLDFKEMLVKERMSDELLVSIKSWGDLINHLKAAAVSGKQVIFSLHEESNLKYTMQWLLTNISGLLTDVEREVQLELNRRTVADHLNNLAHESKLLVELQFEYLARVFSHKDMPLDFNLASFYDKYIDESLHKALYAKPWFKILYHFAASAAVKKLFFGTKDVNIQLQVIMGKVNPQITQTTTSLAIDSLVQAVTKTPFLNAAGDANTGIVNSVTKYLENKKTYQLTGINGYFVPTQQHQHISRAVTILGKLEVLARLTALVHVASYLLHQDGSLLARKETKTQMALFVDLYQNLINQIREEMKDLHETLDGQLQLPTKKRDDAFYQNPNLQMCYTLKTAIYTTQTKCHTSLSAVSTLLKNIEAQRRMLNDLLRWFKQEWFSFMGQHGWLLKTAGKQEQVKQLLQQESVTYPTLPSSEQSLPTLNIDADNVLNNQIMKISISHLVQCDPSCVGLLYFPLEALKQPKVMVRNINQLAVGQRLFCLLKITNEQHSLLAFYRSSEEVILGIYVDMHGYKPDAENIVINYCQRNKISISTLLEPIQSQETNNGICLYEIIKYLQEETHFTAERLWQSMQHSGLTCPEIQTLKRYLWAQDINSWHSAQFNKRFSKITISDSVTQCTQQLNLSQNHLSLKTLKQLLDAFPKMQLSLALINQGLTGKDIKELAETYKDRVTLKHNAYEISLGRRFHQPLSLLERCIRNGLYQQNLWDALLLSLNNQTTHDSQININTPMRDGGTFLHYALDYGRTNICAYLLKHGINEAHKNEQGHTALDHLVQKAKSKPDAYTIPQLKDLLNVLLDAKVPAIPENLSWAKSQATTSTTSTNNFSLTK